MALWKFISAVALLGFQTSFTDSVTLNYQESGWVWSQLEQPHGHETEAISKPLGVAVADGKDIAPVKGWRASLIVTSSMQETNKYTILERIRRDVDASISRAMSLSGKAATAAQHEHMASGGSSRMLDVSSEVIVSTPGTYGMEFSIGTPRQNFTTYADTSSNFVWLKCAPCDECSRDKHFRPDLSSTYAPRGCAACNGSGFIQMTCSSKCHYMATNSDQSTTEGDFSLDTVTLSSSDGASKLVPHFQFGCGHNNTGTTKEIDGFVGLGRGAISFASQIAPALHNVNKFSYCLLEWYADPKQRGLLLFGHSAVPTAENGDVDRVVYTPMLHTARTSASPYYYVSLQDITVGGTKLNIPASAFAVDENGLGGVIFDSGIFYTALTPAVYKLVTDSYVAAIGDLHPCLDIYDQVGLQVCYNATDVKDQIFKIPALVFNFKDADFILPFGNAMIRATLELHSTTEIMCLAVVNSNGPMSIFGSFQQQNFQLIYDNDNFRIGWVERDCKSL
ncbi:hypothetical protein Mapa_006000 [Marchantia paleacea]|nr:hypothetical protein Mapa_006000 [Marchantia paleacea]